MSKPARYEPRMYNGRWRVWDTQTGAPVVVNGVWQVDLTMGEADDLADLLAWQDAQRE